MDPLIKLTTKLTKPNLSVEQKLKEVCLTTSTLIKGADRVSLWRFTDDYQGIESLICLDVSTRSFTSGQQLNKADFADYFAGILEHEVIKAPQARSHPLTQCFNESYFKPLDIYSLLDFILHRDFNPHGIICCESVGKEQQWSEQDVDVLKRIARASSMYFKVED